MEKKFFDVRSQFCCKLDCIELRYQTMLMIDSKAVLQVQIMSPHTTSNSAVIPGHDSNKMHEQATLASFFGHSLNCIFSVPSIIYPTLISVPVPVAARSKA